MTVRTSDNGSHFGSRFENESANTKFGARVKSLREDIGLSQSELASKMGVGKNTIQRYESGDYPKGDYLLKLASIFECSIDWLLTGRDVSYKKHETYPDMVVSEPTIQYSNQTRDNNLVLLQHIDVIKQFKDHELAKVANSDLIDIERLDQATFREIVSYIKGVAKGLKAAESKQKVFIEKRVGERRIKDDDDISEDRDRRQGKNRRAANGS